MECSASTKRLRPWYRTHICSQFLIRKAQKHTKRKEKKVKWWFQHGEQGSEYHGVGNIHQVKIFSWRPEIKNILVEDILVTLGIRQAIRLGQDTSCVKTDTRWTPKVTEQQARNCGEKAGQTRNYVDIQMRAFVGAGWSTLNVKEVRNFKKHLRPVNK